MSSRIAAWEHWVDSQSTEPMTDQITTEDLALNDDSLCDKFSADLLTRLASINWPQQLERRQAKFRSLIDQIDNFLGEDDGYRG